MGDEHSGAMHMTPAAPAINALKTPSLAELLLIRDEELPLLLYFLLFFLLVGAGIALGRGSSNALFLKRFGVEYLPHMYFLMGVSLFAASTLYAAYADRFSPERFFVLLSAILIAALLACRFSMSPTSTMLAYPAYFLVFQVASELLVIHAMLYFSANFDSSQAKRLLPLGLSGVLLGEVAGGYLLTLIARSWGMESVALVWIGLLAVAMSLVWWRHHKTGASLFFRPAKRGGNELRRVAEQLAQGLKFARGSALLRHSSFAVFFMVIALYILSYSVMAVYTAAFRNEEELGIVFGMISMVGGAVALLIQVFFMNKWLRTYGVRKLNLVFPVTTVLCLVALLASFHLPSALLGSFNRRVIMPTVRNSSRNLLFSALPDNIQGRGRAFTLVLVLPLALIVTGLMLYVFRVYASPMWSLLVGVAAGLLYLFYSVKTNRAYVASLLGTLRETLFLPREQLASLVNSGSDQLFNELAAGVRHSDNQICLAYAKILAKTFPERGAEILFERLQGASTPVRDQLTKLIGRHMSQTMRDKLRALLDQGDNHEKATVLLIQFELQDELAQSQVAPCLQAENPRLKACGIYGVFSYGLWDMKRAATQAWKMLLTHSSEEHNVAGLSLLEKLPLPELLPEVYALLEHPAERTCKAALAALRSFPTADPALLARALPKIYASRDHRLRVACVECYHFFPPEIRIKLCFEAMEDAHPQVTDTALRVAREGNKDFSSALKQWFARGRPSPRAQQAALAHLTERPVSLQFFAPVAESKIQEAHALCHVLAVLSTDRNNDVEGQSGACELLEIVLRERRDQAIDLALMAMENVGNPHNIKIVRAALKSKNRRNIARAIEALDGFETKALADEIVTLLDKVAPGKRGQDNRMAMMGPKNTADVLQWCRENLDPWARDCAEHALARSSRAMKAA